MLTTDPAIICSSIGMVKAALEAINGANMYGDKGANWSTIYIDIDAHYRNRITFDTLLPRESASKVTSHPHYPPGGLIITPLPSLLFLSFSFHISIPIIFYFGHLYVGAHHVAVVHVLKVVIWFS